MHHWGDSSTAPNYPEVSASSPRAGGSRGESLYGSSIPVRGSSSPGGHLPHVVQHRHNRPHAARASLLGSSAAFVKDVSGFSKSQRPFLRRSSLNSVFGGGIGSTNPFNVSFGGGASPNVSGAGYTSPVAAGSLPIDLEEALGVAVTAAVRGAVVLVEAEEVRRQENAAKSFARSLREKSVKKEEGGDRKNEETTGTLPQGAAKDNTHQLTSPAATPPTTTSPPFTAATVAAETAVEGPGAERIPNPASAFDAPRRKGGGVGEGEAPGSSAVEDSTHHEGIITSGLHGSRRGSARPISAGSDFIGDSAAGGTLRTTTRRHSSGGSFPQDRIQFLLSSNSLSSPHTTSPPPAGASGVAGSLHLGPSTPSRHPAGLPSGGAMHSTSGAGYASVEHPLLRRAREVVVGFLQAYCDRVMEGQMSFGWSRTHGGGGGSSTPEIFASGSSMPTPSSRGGTGVSHGGGVMEESSDLSSPSLARNVATASLSPIANSPMGRHSPHSPIALHLLSSMGSSGAVGGSRNLKASHKYPSFSPSPVPAAHHHPRHSSMSSVFGGGGGEEGAREKDGATSSPSQPTPSILTGERTVTPPSESQQCRVSDNAGQVRLPGREGPQTPLGSRPSSRHSNVTRRKSSFSRSLISYSPLGDNSTTPPVTATVEGIGCAATSLHGLPSLESGALPSHLSTVSAGFSSSSISSLKVLSRAPQGEHTEKESKKEGGELLSSSRNVMRRNTSPFVSEVQLQPASPLFQEVGSATMGTCSDFLTNNPVDPVMALTTLRPLSSNPGESPHMDRIPSPPSPSSPSSVVPTPIMRFPLSPKRQIVISTTDYHSIPPLPSSPLLAPSVSLCSPSNPPSHRGNTGDEDNSFYPPTISSHDGLFSPNPNGPSSRLRPTLSLPSNLPVPLPCASGASPSPSRESRHPTPKAHLMNTTDMGNTFFSHSPVLFPPLASSLCISPSLTMRILKVSEAPPFPYATPYSPTASSRATFSNSTGTSLRSFAADTSSSSSSSTHSSSSFSAGNSCSTLSASHSLPSVEFDASPSSHSHEYTGSKIMKRMTLPGEMKGRSGRRESKKERTKKGSRKDHESRRIFFPPRMSSKRKSPPSGYRQSTESYLVDSPRSSTSFASFSAGSQAPNSPTMSLEVPKKAKRRKRSCSHRLLVPSLSNTANQSQLTQMLLQQQKSQSHLSQPASSRRPPRLRRHDKRISTSPLSLLKSSLQPGFGDPSLRPSSSASSSFSPHHQGASSPPNSYLWLVDFNEVSALRGLPDTFVSVSLLHDSRPELAVVFFPFVGEKFTWNSFGFLAYTSAMMGRGHSPPHSSPHKGPLGSTGMLSGDVHDVHGSGTQMGAGGFSPSPAASNTTPTEAGLGNGFPPAVPAALPSTSPPSHRGRRTSSVSSPSPLHSHQRQGATPPLGGSLATGSRPFFRPNSSVGNSNIFQLPHAAVERGMEPGTGGRAVQRAANDDSSDSTSEEGLPPQSGEKTPLPSGGVLSSSFSISPHPPPGGRAGSPGKREELNSPLLVPTGSSTTTPFGTGSQTKLQTKNNSNNRSTSGILHNASHLSTKNASQASFGERSSSPKGFLRSSSGALYGRDWAGAVSSHPSPFFCAATSPTKNASTSILPGGSSVHGLHPPLNSSVTGSTVAPVGGRPESSGGGDVVPPASAFPTPHHFTPWWSGGELFVSIEDNGTYLNGTRLRRTGPALEGNGPGGGEGGGESHRTSVSRSASLHPPFATTPSLQSSGSPTLSPTTPSPGMAQPQWDPHAMGGALSFSPSSGMENHTQNAYHPVGSAMPFFQQQATCPPTPPPAPVHQNTLSIATLSTEMSSSSSLLGGHRNRLPPSGFADAGSATLQINTLLSQSYGAGFSTHSSDGADSYPTVSLTSPSKALILLSTAPPAPMPMLPPSASFFHSLPLRRSFSISSATSVTTTTPPLSIAENSSRKGVGESAVTGVTTPASRDGATAMYSPTSSLGPQENAGVRLTSVASHLLRRQDVQGVQFGHHPVVSLVHIAAGRADAALLTDVERLGWHHLLGPALLVQEAGGVVKALTKQPPAPPAGLLSQSFGGVATIQKMLTKAHKEEECVEPIVPEAEHRERKSRELDGLCSSELPSPLPPSFYVAQEGEDASRQGQSEREASPDSKEWTIHRKESAEEGRDRNGHGGEDGKNGRYGWWESDTAAPSKPISMANSTEGAFSSAVMDPPPVENETKMHQLLFTSTHSSDDSPHPHTGTARERSSDATDSDGALPLSQAEERSSTRRHTPPPPPELTTTQRNWVLEEPSISVPPQRQGVTTTKEVSAETLDLRRNSVRRPSTADESRPQRMAMTPNAGLKETNERGLHHFEREEPPEGMLTERRVSSTNDRPSSRQAPFLPFPPDTPPLPSLLVPPKPGAEGRGRLNEGKSKEEEGPSVSPFRYHHRMPTLSPPPVRPNEKNRGLDEKEEWHSALKKVNALGTGNDHVVPERLKRSSTRSQSGGSYSHEDLQGGSHPVFVPQRRLSSTESTSHEAEKRKLSAIPALGNGGVSDSYHAGALHRSQRPLSSQGRGRIKSDGSLVTITSPPILLDSLQTEEEGGKEKKSDKEAEFHHHESTAGLGTRGMGRTLSLPPPKEFSTSNTRKSVMEHTGVEAPKGNAASVRSQGSPPSSTSLFSPPLAPLSMDNDLTSEVNTTTITTTSTTMGLPSSSSVTYWTPPVVPSGVPPSSFSPGRSAAGEEESEKRSFSSTHPTPQRLVHGRSPRHLQHHRREDSRGSRDPLSSLSFRFSSGGEKEGSLSPSSSTSSARLLVGTAATVGTGNTSSAYPPQKLLLEHASSPQGTSSPSLILSPSSIGGAGAAGTPSMRTQSPAIPRKGGRGGSGGGGGGSRRRHSASRSYSEGGRGEESGKRGKDTSWRGGHRASTIPLAPARPEDISGIIATFNTMLAEVISHSVEKSYPQKD